MRKLRLFPWFALLALAALVVWPGLAGSDSRLYGRLMLRPLGFIPDKARPALLSVREPLQKAGMKVASDGSWVAYPEVAAAGYRLSAGGKTILVQADGSFSLPDSLAGEATVSHPTARWQTHFPVNSLSTQRQDAKRLVWPIPFRMGMGMAGGSMCAPMAANPVEVASDSGMSGGLADAGSFHVSAVPSKIRTGPLGTYPDPNPPVGLVCEITDGPFHTGYKEVDYFFSTCDAYVRAGICLNENTLSDVEYDALMGGPLGPLLGLAGGELPRPVMPGPKAPPWTSQCEDNHKGRFCQQLKPGDVSVGRDANNLLASAGGSGQLEVQAGKPIRFLVHNNGAFGVTDIEKTRNELGGTLSCGNRLLHYSGDHNNYVYIPDQEVTYQTKSKKDGTDTYVFQADGQQATLNFVQVGGRHLAVVVRISLSGERHEEWKNGATQGLQDDQVQVEASCNAIYRLEPSSQGRWYPALVSFANQIQIQGKGKEDYCGSVVEQNWRHFNWTYGMERQPDYPQCRIGGDLEQASDGLHGLLAGSNLAAYIHRFGDEKGQGGAPGYANSAEIDAWKKIGGQMRSSGGGAYFTLPSLKGGQVSGHASATCNDSGRGSGPPGYHGTGKCEVDVTVFLSP